VNNTGIYFIMLGGGFSELLHLGILTADVGGCTLIDADEFRLVWDTWVRGNRVFIEKTRYSATKWEKTRFI
jgi:hypothetical protein